jgi:hypothetical protein
MPYTTLNLGLTLTIPVSGTRNYASTLLSTTWSRISQHTHTGGGDGNKMVTASLTDLCVTTAKLDNNSVTQGKLSKNLAFNVASTLTPSGTTQTVDWNNGNMQKLDLASASGNVTLTLSNPIAGAVYKLLVVQGAAPLDLVYPASVKFPQGQTPILSTSASAVDIITFYYDGTSYFADWELDYK